MDDQHAPIHVTVLGSADDPRVDSSIPGVVIHRVPALHPDDLTSLNGIPLTTPSRTLIDLAEDMTRDELRATKSQPRYTGPFLVVRRTKGGSYVLRGPDGTEYRRPPNALKRFHQSAEALPTSVEVTSIIDHLEDPSTLQFSYLVQWADGTESWTSASDFDDVQPIQAYWQRLKGKSKTKRLCSTPSATKSAKRHSPRKGEKVHSRTN